MTICDKCGSKNIKHRIRVGDFAGLTPITIFDGYLCRKCYKAFGKVLAESVSSPIRPVPSGEKTGG
jgi:hypothetical protein